jgi:hypothetical protein
MMQQSYTALRTIGTIYKILGVITVIATVLVALGVGRFFGTGGVFALIGGGAIALTLYAAGEGVFLLLALEENTRLTATLLQRQAGATIQTYPSAPGAPPPGYAGSSAAASSSILNTNPTGRSGQVQPRE